MSIVSNPAAFHFLRPLWLLLLPALWLLAALLARRRARDGHWSKLIDAQLLPLLRLETPGTGAPAGAPVRSPARARVLLDAPWPLLILGWSVAVLALAGPSWQREQTRTYRVPAAWVMVLDLSPSMQATDVAPDRMTRARYAIDDLLSAAHGARVGLVAFSGEPYAVAPLTDDIATVRLLLGPLSPTLMPEHGEQLAPALEEAGRLLQANRGSGLRGQIILLTDGCTDPARAMLAAAQLRAQGARVQVVGIGTAGGAPQPDGAGGFVHDARGQVLLARLDTDMLTRIAAAGGGRFVPLSGLPELIERLQAEQAASRQSAQAAPQLQLARWRDDGIWLLPAVLLLAAPLARRGWL